MKNNILIAYYSWSGNTRKIAGLIDWVSVGRFTLRGRQLGCDYGMGWNSNDIRSFSLDDTPGNS